MLDRVRTYLPSSLHNSAERTAFAGLAVCIAMSLVSIAISQMFLALAIGASFWVLKSHKKYLLTIRGLCLPLALFLIWTILACLMAPDAGLALTVSKKFYLFLLIPIVPLIANGPGGKLIWIYRAIFATALLESLLGIFQYITNFHNIDLLHRISGFMGHWMTYSGLLMLALILLIAYGLRASWKRAFLWVPAAAALALAIALSQTRNTVLGVYAGIFAVLVFATILERRRRFTVFFICLILFSGALYFAAPHSMQQRFRAGLDPNDPNTRNRIELIDTSVRMIRDNPWFGVGPKNVKSEALKYRNVNEFPDWLYQHMHNNILQIAVMTGIPGLVLWLWFMIRLAWDSLRTYRHALSRNFPYGDCERREAVLASSAALGCWAALMIAGLFEYNFGDSEVLTLFLFIASAPYCYFPVSSNTD